MKKLFVLSLMVLVVAATGFCQTAPVTPAATTTTVQTDMFVNQTPAPDATFDEDNPATTLGTEEHSWAFEDTPDGSVPGTENGEWAEEPAPTWTVTTPSGTEVEVPNESVNKDEKTATMGEPDLTPAEPEPVDWEVEEPEEPGFEEEDEGIPPEKEEPKEPECPLPPHTPKEPGEYTIHNGVARRTEDTETQVPDPDKPGETITVTENADVEAEGGTSYYVDDVTAPLVDVGISQDQGKMEEVAADGIVVKERRRQYSVKMNENPKNQTRDKKSAGIEINTASLVRETAK